MTSACEKNLIKVLNAGQVCHYYTMTHLQMKLNFSSLSCDVHCLIHWLNLIIFRQENEKDSAEPLHNWMWDLGFKNIWRWRVLILTTKNFSPECNL
jgi:ribosomal protein S26